MSYSTPSRRLPLHLGLTALALSLLALACSSDPASPPTNETVGGAGGNAGGNAATGGQAAGGDTSQGGGQTTSGGGTGTGGDGGGAASTPVTIVVLGASTACGKNLDKPIYGGEAGGLAFAWTALYAEQLAATRPGSTLINLCNAGYNSYHAMPTGTVNPAGMPAVDDMRNITAALTYGPDAIIVAFPAADETSDVAEIHDNLLTIEATASAGGVLTWIGTPQPTENMSAGALANKLSLRTLIVDAPNGRGLDFWAPLAGPNDTWDPAKGLTDGVHPNKTGHALLFDMVVAANIPASVSQ